jgi:hypothetical protein
LRDWRKIFADAKKRGLANCDLATELGVSPAAVTRQAAKHGVCLSRKPGSGRRFKNAHVPKFRCPEEWGLTPQQAQLVAVLVDADGDVSPVRLYDLVIGADRNPQAVDVVLCRARKKLEPFGIHIDRYYGKGAFIDPLQRARLRAGAVTLKPSERTP